MSLVLLDDDMKAVIAACRLGYAATVTSDGRPNLSPKGTVRVWDDHHLFFLDIASPRTRENLLHNPWMEINVVDPISRRGYRFLGRAMVHAFDAVHREASERIDRGEGVAYVADAAILLAVERAAPLVSPGYDHVDDEHAMRALWLRRREGLEEEFEEHVRRRGPWPGTGPQET